MWFGIIFSVVVVWAIGFIFTLYSLPHHATTTDAAIRVLWPITAIVYSICGIIIWFHWASEIIKESFTK